MKKDKYFFSFFSGADVLPYSLSNFRRLSQTRTSMCPRTVLLTGIPDIMDRETMQDMLEIHFQKNGNDGGEIEAFLYNPLGQQTLALFGSATPEPEEE